MSDLKGYLKARTNTVTDKYIDELLVLEQEVEKRRVEVNEEFLNVEKQKDLLRAKDKEIEEKLHKESEKIAEKLIELRKTQSTLTDEISNYNRLKNEVVNKNGKVDNELKTIRSERQMISRELEKQRDLSRTYELKIHSLTDDVKKIKKRNDELNIREQAVKVKEKINLTEERRLLSRDQELAERELAVKIDEKMIRLEYKKLKLKDGS